MACQTLSLTNEVFGPSIAPPVVGRAPARGEWVGVEVQATNADVTTVVTGVSVRTLLTVANPQDAMVTVTVPVGGGAERSVQLGWVPPGAGGRTTSLTAVRFVNADFLALRHFENPTTVTTYAATYVFFDLRPRPTGAAAPEPVVIGPFDVPLQIQHQFSHSAAGQLALFWRDSAAGSASGRVAAVYRTDVARGATAQPLVTVDDATAAGTVACRVDTGGSRASLGLYDNAQRQGNTAVVLTTASRRLAEEPTPTPGTLKLSRRTLQLAAGTTTASVTMTNDGQDLLELTGVSSSSATITASTAVPLPRCVAPGESVPLMVTRAGVMAAAVTATVTVAAVPVSAANTISVTASAVAARPAVAVSPSALSWRVGQAGAQSLAVRNAGNVPVDVSVPGPVGATAFAWAAVPATTLQPGASRRVDVTFTSPGAGTVASTLTVSAFLVGTTTPVAGFPLTVPLVGNAVANVPPGALQIIRIVADPPGNDLLPDGEFVEIANVTDRSLDLTGCRIQHTRFSPSGQSGFGDVLPALGPAAFGGDSSLPPRRDAGVVARVYTRARVAGDSGAFRIYAGMRQAVWNNDRDTGRILNDFGEEVHRLSYVATFPPPGTALPTGTVVSPTAARRRLLVRRVFVDARLDWSSVFPVQDGDVVVVAATGTARFDHWGHVAGPAGLPASPAGADAPLPGAPSWGLIGTLGGARPFFVGAGTTLTVNVDGGPYMLSFGPNDSGYSDNAGEFDCRVELYR